MTIGIILGFIFAIALIVCAVLSISFFAGRKLFAGRKNNMTIKRPLAGGLTAGAAAAAFILFLFIPFSFHTVNAGEIAVVKHLGDARSVRTAGTYFDFWITERYDRYDAKVQNLNINANTYSKDGQSMDILINVQYQMDTARALEIANNYGSLDALSVKIESVTEGRAKAVLANYSAMEIIENRAKATEEVEKEVKNAIDKDYYAYINTVVLTNIDFTDAFEKTVEDKMIAEQEKLKAQYEKETAIINAEKEFEVAKKQAEAKIEVAKADAEAQKLIASAEAYAAKIKIVELARSMGYNVTSTVVGEETIYEIEWGVGAEAESGKKLLIEYMEYLEYLAKWNGKLPDVMMDGNSGTVMVPLPSDPTT